MNQPSKYPRAYTLLATSTDTPADVDEAKAYVKKHGLTSEDVKIVRSDGSVLVVTKKEIELKEI